MLAVISGATRGIGKAIAEALASEGFDLAIAARNSQELKALESDLLNRFPEIAIFSKPVDFSQKEEIKEFTREIQARWNDVEVIVNNVGAFIPGTIPTEEDSLLDFHLQNNLYSSWYLTRPFLDRMKKAEKGHIFTICSVAALNPRSDAASYSISKAAQYAFHKTLCEEMRSYNVKCTVILPGSVNTSSWSGIDAPLNKFVQPGDIASALINAYKTSQFALMEEIIIRPLDKSY